MASKKPLRELTRVRLTTSLHILLPENCEPEAKMTKIEYYKISKQKNLVYWILSILTLGIIPLLCYWKYSIRVFFKYEPTHYSDPEYLLIYGLDKTIEHVKAETRAFYLEAENVTAKSFCYRLYTYYFDKKEELYKPCEYSLKGKSFKKIHQDLGKGIDSIQTYEQKWATFGPNSTEITIKSDLKILFDQVATPFYLFQLYSVLIWTLLVPYETYAYIILIISVLSIIVSFIKTRKRLRKLQSKVEYRTEIRAYRPSKLDGSQIPMIISSDKLVPGDLVEIPKGRKMPCDILLLSGTCIMNESTLTGETMLVTKTALPRDDQIFDIWTAQQHILYSGTECLEAAKTETEPQIIGLVVRTGFWTMKARMIRAYVFMKESSFGLAKDALKFYLVVWVIAILCFFICVKSFTLPEYSDSDFVFGRFMNIFTIAVPTNIPVCTLLSVFILALRLRRKNIIIRSDTRIDYAGQVDFACFDKTGTLTRDGFDLHGVKPVSYSDSSYANFCPLIKESFYLNLQLAEKQSPSHLLLQLMATCHNLTYIDDKLSGDPFDLKMYEAVGWCMTQRERRKSEILYTLEPPETFRNPEVKVLKTDPVVLKRFEKSVKHERLTVICKSETEHTQRINIKGKPEMVAKLCRPETLPQDLDEVLFRYEQCGYQVIACATRIIGAKVKTTDNLSRDFFEKDLDFLGLLVFENKIKDETPKVIANLIKADIPPIMLSSDNVSPAIFAAKACGILDVRQKIFLGTYENARAMTSFTETLESDKEGMRFSHLKEHLKTELDQSEDKLMSEDPYSPQTQNEILTAIDADKDISIVMTSDALNYLRTSITTDPELYKNVLRKTRVYTNMSPEDKAIVIDELQKQGLVVAMCGDGTNDCPALKAAKVSIALGEGEASLAAAFTSRTPDISCLETILREGRCSLVTNFQRYKFIALYIMIQVILTVVLYMFYTDTPNPSFFYQDIIVVLAMAMALGFTPPADTLSRKRPVTKLMIPEVLISFLGHTIIQGCALGATLVITQKQDWYKSRDMLRIEDGEEDITLWTLPNYDSTAMCMVCNMAYFSLILAFSISRPFRQPFYKNWVLAFIYLYTAVLNVVIIFSDSPAVIDTLQMRDFNDTRFRWIIFGITLVSMFITITYEKLIVPRIASCFSRRQTKTKKKYQA